MVLDTAGWSEIKQKRPGIAQIETETPVAETEEEL
jgi:hypothetical protein